MYLYRRHANRLTGQRSENVPNVSLKKTLQNGADLKTMTTETDPFGTGRGKKEDR